MASIVASKRLTKEYKNITNSPPPFIVAQPDEKNILIWYYLIDGPPETPYDGGQYYGKLVFPRDYPFKPPAIMMVTPSGRFMPNTKLCLSMSSYHPETWNPAWSVGTILTGLLSFMTGDDPTTGAISTSTEQKKLLASSSRKWNSENAAFRKTFPELCKSYKKLSNDPNVVSNIPIEFQDSQDVQSISSKENKNSTVRTKFESVLHPKTKAKTGAFLDLTADDYEEDKGNTINGNPSGSDINHKVKRSGASPLISNSSVIDLTSNPSPNESKEIVVIELE